MSRVALSYYSATTILHTYFSLMVALNITSVNILRKEELVSQPHSFHYILLSQRTLLLTWPRKLHKKDKTNVKTNEWTIIEQELSSTGPFQRLPCLIMVPLQGYMNLLLFHFPCPLHCLYSIDVLFSHSFYFFITLVYPWPCTHSMVFFHLSLLNR